MQFRMTYAGLLLGDRTDASAPKRSIHKHDLRRHFHRQLRVFWQKHPTMIVHGSRLGTTDIGPMAVYRQDGFDWLPIATEHNGLVCKLDILMLREGPPGRVITDIDNRLKTLFDALKMPRDARELGSGTPEGVRTPSEDEHPFYVLVEDDRLITHVAVTTDMLLEPVPEVPPENAVRLVIDVTIRPYRSTLDNMDFV